MKLDVWDHDRCMPLHDGRVSVPFESHILPTGKLFPIAVKEARFDITELRFQVIYCKFHVVSALIPLSPLFCQPAFRHNGFFARAEALLKHWQILLANALALNIK